MVTSYARQVLHLSMQMILCTQCLLPEKPQLSCVNTGEVHARCSDWNGLHRKDWFSTQGKRHLQSACDSIIILIQLNCAVVYIIIKDIGQSLMYNIIISSIKHYIHDILYRTSPQGTSLSDRMRHVKFQISAFLEKFRRMIPFMCRNSQDLCQFDGWLQRVCFVENFLQPQMCGVTVCCCGS